MNFIYNLLQVLLAPLLVPALTLSLLFRPEKRAHLCHRLGIGLQVPARRKAKTVWVQALSVGEVTSALPLVKRLHQDRKTEVTIVFSTTTASGHRLAEQIIAPHCDALVHYPFDFYPLVRRVVEAIKPDLYILIETDFWPNLSRCLGNSGIPMLLFNGRVSAASSRRYRRFARFFRPLFDGFSLLCMQTSADARNMRALGIAEEKIRTLGNLKFAAAEPMHDGPAASPFPPAELVLLAGSTHAGEEELLAEAFFRLPSPPSRHLVIAPRDISRCREIAMLLEQKGHSVNHFSQGEPGRAEVTIVDTIGDLAGLYRFADVCFIGGSLVPEGGHNPLEAARVGRPILFGPHMDDFSEISKGLLAEGGALQVTDRGSLDNVLDALATDPAKRQATGTAAARFAAGGARVLADHLAVVDLYL